MDELNKIREELDRTFDYERSSEKAVMQQRRETRERDEMFAEERAGRQSLPPHLRG